MLPELELVVDNDSKVLFFVGLFQWLPMEEVPVPDIAISEMKRMGLGAVEWELPCR